MSVDAGKAKKILSESFVENHSNVTEDEAQNLVVRSLQKIKGLEEERESDDKLAAARQVKKDLEAGYSSAIQYEKAKISFLLEKIEEIQAGEVNPTSGANV